MLKVALIGAGCISKAHCHIVGASDNILPNTPAEYLRVLVDEAPKR